MEIEQYKNNFLSFIDILFYGSHEEKYYSSFILDFSDKETRQYFVNSCILWFKLVHGLEINNDIVKDLYIKYSQYNVFPTKKEDAIDKFIITKSVLEKMFETKIIPNVTYELENTTVKKLNPEDYIKKKK